MNHEDVTKKIKTMLQDETVLSTSDKEFFSIIEKVLKELDEYTVGIKNSDEKVMFKPVCVPESFVTGEFLFFNSFLFDCSIYFKDNQENPEETVHGIVGYPANISALIVTADAFIGRAQVAIKDGTDDEEIKQYVMNLTSMIEKMWDKRRDSEKVISKNGIEETLSSLSLRIYNANAKFIEDYSSLLFNEKFQFFKNRILKGESNDS